MEIESIAKFAKKHGIEPLKKYGQNFIFDETLCDKIVRASGIKTGEFVVEVGPGTAGLTRSILKTQPVTLKSIEMDKRCIALLTEIQNYFNNLDLINADALKIKISDICAGKEVKIISNLPYNIGTKLILNWFLELHVIKSMTLMLQREVAERIVAQPGTKSYGRLSVISQLCCSSHICFDVSPKAFYPQPKVWSSVIHMTSRQDRPSEHLLKQLQKVTNLAFSGRRKMIKSSLKNLTPKLDEILSELCIEPQIRAENVTPMEYLQIALNTVN